MAVKRDGPMECGMQVIPHPEKCLFDFPKKKFPKMSTIHFMISIREMFFLQETSSQYKT